MFTVHCGLGTLGTSLVALGGNVNSKNKIVSYEACGTISKICSLSILKIVSRWISLQIIDSDIRFDSFCKEFKITPSYISVIYL